MMAEEAADERAAQVGGGGNGGGGGGDCGIIFLIDTPIIFSLTWAFFCYVVLNPCVISQQSWFWGFLFHKFFIFPTSLTFQAQAAAETAAVVAAAEPAPVVEEKPAAGGGNKGGSE